MQHNSAGCMAGIKENPRVVPVVVWSLVSVRQQMRRMVVGWRRWGQQ
jgi:hypothetical protein